MELLGLILTIAGLAGIFLLWLQVMGNKAKAGQDSPEPDAKKPISVSSQPSPRLIPTISQDTSAPVNAPSEPLLVQDGSFILQQPDPADVAEDHSEPEAPEASSTSLLIKTQLDIAVQLFQTGDFEGACEMAEIVIESGAASELQAQKARELLELCA